MSHKKVNTTENFIHCILKKYGYW